MTLQLEPRGRAGGASHGHTDTRSSASGPPFTRPLPFARAWAAIVHSGLAGPALAAFALLALGLASAPSLKPMVQMWRGEEYGYAWLVPPLATLIFMHRVPASARGGAPWLGVAVVALSAAFMLLGRLTASAWFSIYGGIGVVYGIVWAALGLRAMRRLSAPILYLFFMIPLPLATYLTVSNDLQLLASRVGVFLISLTGISVGLEGNVIDLAAGRLEVAAACSGLRYLFPLASFGFLIAMMFEGAAWKKLLIVASTVPIAIILNAGRIAIVGVLVSNFGMALAGGTQHDVEGFVIFLLCVAVLIFEVAALQRIGSGGRFAPMEILVPEGRRLRALGDWSIGPAFLAACAGALLCATALSAMPERTNVTPQRRTLTLFPMDLQDWRGTPFQLDADTLGALKLTDYVSAQYMSRAWATPIDFYVAYYATQKFGMQAHSPRLCIPGGGWNITHQGVVPVESAKLRLWVNRVVIEKNGVKQVLYYWFDERGRNLVDEYSLKFYALKDAVTMNRSDGALVRIATPIGAGGEGAADRRLQEFMGSVQPVLSDYIPQ